MTGGVSIMPIDMGFAFSADKTTGARVATTFAVVGGPTEAVALGGCALLDCPCATSIVVKEMRTISERFFMVFGT